MARNTFAAVTLSTIGGAIVVAGGLSLWNAWRTAFWPTAVATITTSTLTSSENADGRTMYRPLVEYEFVIGGASYRGNRIQFGPAWRTSSSTSAQRVADRYPAQSRHQVSYDPRDPARSVLKVGAPWILYIVFGIGALFLWLGVVTWMDAS